MVIKELQGLDARGLRKIQAAIGLFHLLGMSDEDINSLLQIVRAWPSVVQRINDISVDQGKLNELVSSELGKTPRQESAGAKDTYQNIKDSSGIGQDIVRLNLEKALSGGEKK